MHMQHFNTAMYLHKGTDHHRYLRIVTDRRLFSPSTLIAQSSERGMSTDVRSIRHPVQTTGSATPTVMHWVNNN